MSPSTQSPEAAARRRLGIPEDAARVLILGESSHWDPDWLLTSDEYFQRRVRRTLDRAIDALLREEARVYSIECVFFLKLYFERCPERQDAVRDLVNAGRLRLTGSGMTTPGTVLPDTEALLRDYLIGQEWLRENGMTQEPRVAYLPDNFGNSPALPSILAALGVTGAAFARLDGAYFPGCDYRAKTDFPLPGSSAERLLSHGRSLDFVWRDTAGAEVFAHFCAHGYGQGDLLAHRGLTRWMGLPLAIPARSEAHVAARIAGYVAQLAPLARTPYLYCPIGFDFVDPIADLTRLIERYNRVRYGDSGVFVVNAALDDLLDLVSFHRESLPIFELDPNPYWMGFTASRPGLKRRCRRLVQSLLDAESLELDGQGWDQPASDLTSAWLWAAVSNHHDFITGTSPDRVYRVEQRPRVDEALAVAEARIAQLRAPTESPGARSAGAIRWEFGDGEVRIATGRFRAALDIRRGGCIASFEDVATGQQLLGPCSADLVSYRDTGGLWRMGHEYRGGSLTEIARQSEGPAEVEVKERGGVLEVSTHVRVAGDQLLRTMWFSPTAPFLRLRVGGRIRPGRVLLLRLRTDPLVDEILVDVPGGVATRPAERLYSPTFWAASRFVRARRHAGGLGLAILSQGPASVALDVSGTLDCVALRNAPQEKAFGWLPMLGFPIAGHELEDTQCDVAVCFPDRDQEAEHRLRALARSAFDDASEGRPRGFGYASRIVSVDAEEAEVLALKRASRGEGHVVRLCVPRQPGRSEVSVQRRGVRVDRAWLCDARERDLEPLDVRGGAARVPVRSSILTVRLIEAGNGAER